MIISAILRDCFRNSALIPTQTYPLPHAAWGTRTANFRVPVGSMYRQLLKIFKMNQATHILWLSVIFFVTVRCSQRNPTHTTACSVLYSDCNTAAACCVLVSGAVRVCGVTAPTAPHENAFESSRINNNRVMEPNMNSQQLLGYIIK